MDVRRKLDNEGRLRLLGLTTMQTRYVMADTIEECTIWNGWERVKNRRLFAEREEL